MKSRALREAPRTLARLHEAHPDAHCELIHANAFELIIATVLSAQSTDVAVNKLTPELFERWPDPERLSVADPAEVETLLSRIGMFRQKTRNVIGLARGLMADHAGRVPRSMEELVRLPGVGRKTANVVLGVAFGASEGVVVDTHVQRISQRLGWTRHADPEHIERDLMKLFPRERWDMLAHILIFHGRRICTARKPACAACPVNDVCPSAFHAEDVGRKAPRVRSPSVPEKKPGKLVKVAKRLLAKASAQVANTTAKRKAKAESETRTSKRKTRPAKPRTRSSVRD
jgi:endonuclease-3